MLREGKRLYVDCQFFVLGQIYIVYGFFAVKLKGKRHHVDCSFLVLGQIYIMYGFLVVKLKDQNILSLDVKRKHDKLEQSIINKMFSSLIFFKLYIKIFKYI